MEPGKASAPRHGVYVGAGQVTKNAPCATLFVTQVPGRISPSTVRALFEKEPGFTGCRNVRNIYFIDFVTIPVASAAMRKYQGFKFPNLEHKLGICIDYDKDSSDKRVKQVEKQRIRDFIQRDRRFVIGVNCSICETQALSLRLLPPLSLPSLRRRPLDRSIVLDATSLVLDHSLSRSAFVPFFRPEGVEIRTPLLCKTCEAEVAYACVGEGEQIRYIFLHPHAIRAVDYKGQFTRVYPYSTEQIQQQQENLKRENENRFEQTLPLVQESFQPSSTMRDSILPFSSISDPQQLNSTAHLIQSSIASQNRDQ